MGAIYRSTAGEEIGLSQKKHIDLDGNVLEGSMTFNMNVSWITGPAQLQPLHRSRHPAIVAALSSNGSSGRPQLPVG